MNTIPNWPPVYEGSAGTPMDRLTDNFLRLSEDYPGSLVGANSGLGLAALDTLDRGELSWDSFADSALGGDTLRRAVRHTVKLHEEANVPPVKGLAQIVPHIYSASKYAVITAIAEFMRAEDGQAHDTIVAPNAVTVRTVGDYLADSRRRSALLQLFGASAVALLESGRPPQLLGEEYRDALFDLPSADFPQPSELNRQQKKEELARRMRPLLLEEIEPLALGFGLKGTNRLEIFVHNITRP
jgi:hypothetical protein